MSDALARFVAARALSAAGGDAPGLRQSLAGEPEAAGAASPSEWRAAALAVAARLARDDALCRAAGAVADALPGARVGVAPDRALLALPVLGGDEDLVSATLAGPDREGGFVVSDDGGTVAGLVARGAATPASLSALALAHGAWLDPGTLRLATRVARWELVPAAVVAHAALAQKLGRLRGGATPADDDTRGTP